MASRVKSHIARVQSGCPSQSALYASKPPEQEHDPPPNDTHRSNTYQRLSIVASNRPIVSSQSSSVRASYPPRLPRLSLVNPSRPPRMLRALHRSCLPPNSPSSSSSVPDRSLPSQRPCQTQSTANLTTGIVPFALPRPRSSLETSPTPQLVHSPPYRQEPPRRPRPEPSHRVHLARPDRAVTVHVARVQHVLPSLAKRSNSLHITSLARPRPSSVRSNPAASKL